MSSYQFSSPNRDQYASVKQSILL